MGITLIFGLFLLTFTGFLCARGLPGSSVFHSRRRVPSWLILGVCLLWSMLVVFGTYWGFLVEPPHGFDSLKAPANGYFAQWLVVLVMASVPLSYSAFYRAGERGGYLQGRTQARLALSPVHLGEDTVGAYFFPSEEWRAGGKLFVAASGRTYVVRSVTRCDDLVYVVASLEGSNDERVYSPG